MKKLSGKESREKLIAEIRSLLPGRKLSFYLYSDAEDMSSRAYLRGVKKALEAFAIPYEEGFLDKSDVEKSLQEFTGKAKGHYTVLSRPLHVPEEERFLQAIDPDYDPDMATERNVGRLFLGDMAYLPATARSVYRLLKDNAIETTGKKALLIGRSRTIGLPLLALMSHLNAGVFLAHSRIKAETLNLQAKESDIILLASGKKGLVARSSFNPGQVVIDCGYQDGTGDLGFLPEEGELFAYTPVPGGVGVLTSYCLILNAILLDMEKNKETFLNKI